MGLLQCFVVELYYSKERVSDVMLKSPSNFGCEGLPEGRGVVFQLLQEGQSVIPVGGVIAF